MDELLSLFGGAVGDHGHASSAASNDRDDHCPKITKASISTDADTTNAEFRSALGAVREVDTSNWRGEHVDQESYNGGSSTTTASSSSSSGTLRSSTPDATAYNPTYPTNKMNTNNIMATRKKLANINNTPCCDPITGLRIVDRRTSRADMVDAFSSFTYRTCSTLAASSRVEWSREYLVDGAGQTNDGSNTIGGKTNLVTCGILTGETSSRLSTKTGRAFATLTMGDLPSSTSSFSNSSSLSSSNEIHASITVFLFGDALSVLRADTKQYLRPGWAVAILGPNLMPPRIENTRTNGGGGGSTTSVTLSVNDPRQVLPIGRAVDCNRCKGTIRKRVASDSAPPRWEDVCCSTLVDARHSGGRGYCQMHRKQGLSSACSGGTNKISNNGSNLTFMQRQRNEHTMQHIMPSTQGRGIARSSDGNCRPGIGGDVSYSSQSGLFHDRPPTSCLPDQKASTLKRAPLHMKKTPNINVVVVNATTKSTKVIKTFDNDSISTTDPKRKLSQHDILGEALDGKRLRSAIVKDKQPQLKVFNATGYDGSVQVPKPSAILFQHISSRNSCSTYARPSLPLDQHSSASILGKQRSLAELLKKNAGTSTFNATNAFIDRPNLTRSKQKIMSTQRDMNVVLSNTIGSTTSQSNHGMNDFASAFSSSNTGTGEQVLNDTETILNAKSRFASAVSAIEYARARSVVQALETKESAKEGMNSRKKDAKSPLISSIVTTGWACRNCKKTTPFKPLSCIHARHDVRQCRELNGDSSKSLGSHKNRLDMHGKDEVNGGLTLGSGLEWSGWRGGFG